MHYYKKYRHFMKNVMLHLFHIMRQKDRRKIKEWSDCSQNDAYVLGNMSSC